MTIPAIAPVAMKPNHCLPRGERTHPRLHFKSRYLIQGKSIILLGLTDASHIKARMNPDEMTSVSGALGRRASSLRVVLKSRIGNGSC